MATDTLIFRDDGKSSFTTDPGQDGIMYCKHCGSWHSNPKLDSGTKFCAFCYTTHHSRSCGAGLGEKCPDPSIDPIHSFLEKQCEKHQKFDLSFCVECNCFHSKQAFRICLEKNRPKRSWGKERTLIWKLRWRLCSSSEVMIKKERSLFNITELMRFVPYEYPFANGRFVHHCNV